MTCLILSFGGYWGLFVTPVLCDSRSVCLGAGHLSLIALGIGWAPSRGGLCPWGLSKTCWHCFSGSFFVCSFRNRLCVGYWTPWSSFVPLSAFLSCCFIFPSRRLPQCYLNPSVELFASCRSPPSAGSFLSSRWFFPSHVVFSMFSLMDVLPFCLKL